MKTLFDKIEKQTYVDRLELWKMGKLTPDGKYAAKPIFASALFRHLATPHDYKILTQPQWMSRIDEFENWHSMRLQKYYKQSFNI